MKVWVRCTRCGLALDGVGPQDRGAQQAHLRICRGITVEVKDGYSGSRPAREVNVQPSAPSASSAQPQPKKPTRKPRGVQAVEKVKAELKQRAKEAANEALSEVLEGLFGENK